MAAHPYIRPYTLDLSDSEEKSSDVMRLFEKVSENTPALVILEDLDRAFPTEGKRTRERAVSFQTLLNCLDGVGTQDGVIVVATANDQPALTSQYRSVPDGLIAWCSTRIRTQICVVTLQASQPHSQRRGIRNRHPADGRILVRPMASWERSRHSSTAGSQHC
jgi:ATPase family associated with various cellular activities (AAA)